MTEGATGKACLGSSLRGVSGIGTQPRVKQGDKPQRVRGIPPFLLLCKPATHSPRTLTYPLPTLCPPPSPSLGSDFACGFISPCQALKFMWTRSWCFVSRLSCLQAIFSPPSPTDPAPLCQDTPPGGVSQLYHHVAWLLSLACGPKMLPAISVNILPTTTPSVPAAPNNVHRGEFRIETRYWSQIVKMLIKGTISISPDTWIFPYTENH